MVLINESYTKLLNTENCHSEKRFKPVKIYNLKRIIFQPRASLTKRSCTKYLKGSERTYCVDLDKII